MKKMISCALLTAICLSISGCGGLFDKDYTVVADYPAPAVIEQQDTDKVAVKNLSTLKQAVTGFVTEGKEYGVVIFDSTYDGDVTEDIASACWQVRTQNALCSYCVENIAYEVNTIVSHKEAEFYISYSDTAMPLADIVMLNYSTAISDIIADAIKSGSRQLVIFVNNSTYSAASLSAMADKVYQANPTIVPQRPVLNTTVYAGSGRQKLFDIEIDYGMDEETMRRQVEELAAIDPFAGFDLKGVEDSQLAYYAYRYLAESCTPSDSSQYNTVYAALVKRTADSEGIALAYCELCSRLSIPCEIVYGQKNRTDCCWNIVKLGGNYYHADISSCIINGNDYYFLSNDRQMWESYRWDTSAYKPCTEAASFTFSPYSDLTNETPVL